MGRSFVREPNVRAESAAAVVSPSVTGKRRGDSLFSIGALIRGQGGPRAVKLLLLL